jgi:hypothetical protein
LPTDSVPFQAAICVGIAVTDHGDGDMHIDWAC